jgi:hypothetical protein
MINSASTPHQGIEQQIPNPKISHETSGPVRCRPVLGAFSTTTIATPREGKLSYCTDFLRLRVMLKRAKLRTKAWSDLCEGYRSTALSSRPLKCDRMRFMEYSLPSVVLRAIGDKGGRHQLLAVL